MAAARDTAAALAILVFPLFAVLLIACLLPWLSRSYLSNLCFRRCEDHFDDWSSYFHHPAGAGPLFTCAEKLLPSYNRPRHRGGPDEQVDCCFCLCRVEEWDEARELRCRHLFHRACLDRWVDVGRTECPLCRQWLSTPGEPRPSSAIDIDYDHDHEISTLSGMLLMVGLHIGWRPS